MTLYSVCTNVVFNHGAVHNILILVSILEIIILYELRGNRCHLRYTRSADQNNNYDT